MDLFGQPTSAASLDRQILRVEPGGRTPADDPVAVEEPLEILIRHRGSTERLTVTMRTPGDEEDLVVGFLLAEGIIARVGDLQSVEKVLVDGSFHNQVLAHLSDDLAFDPDHFRRNVLTTSACGICGRSSIEHLVTRHGHPIERNSPMSLAILMSLPSALTNRQTTFATTGGLHAAAVVRPDGDIVAVREDIGRHNAVDKVIGFCATSNTAVTADHLLVVSGRASYELVQKAIVAEIGTLVSIGPPSTLAIDLATEFNLMLVGFTKSNTCNVYTCQGEVVA